MPWTIFTPGITLWTNPFSRFVYFYPPPLPEQVCYSYSSLPQYVHTLAVTTIHCRYIHCMAASPIYLHSPLSSKAHPCWCKCSIKSDDGPHIAVKTNVTTLLMAVLSILKCLYKIGQSSSYHPVTSCISVLCPVQSLRSMTSKDSCNIPTCFHMDLEGTYSCQHHCDVVWTDTTELLKCYLYLYYFWYHLGTSHLSGQQYYPYIMLYVSCYNWAPARRSIHKE